MFSLLSLCRQFSAFSEKRSQSRPNNLDKCRRNFIKKNLVSLFSGPSFTHHHLPACFSLPDWMSYFVQILLARQAVRARRRITRRTAKQRLMESKRFLKKLRLLAVEVRVQRVWLILTKKMLKITLCTICCKSDIYCPRCALFSPRVPSQMLSYG